MIATIYPPNRIAVPYQARTLMGSISQVEVEAATDAGYDLNDINALSAAGATDSDIVNMLNGAISLAALQEEYGTGSYATVPATIATTTTTPATTVAAAPAAQVPSGSTVTYTAGWSAGIGNLTVSPNSVISSLTSGLAAHGMSVTGSSVTSNGPLTYGIQVTVLDSVGNNLLTDAKSVLDSIVNGAIGGTMSSSNISLTSTPSQAGNTVATTPASSVTSWLENNAIWIALIGGAVIVLPAIFGGKKR